MFPGYTMTSKVGIYSAYLMLFSLSCTQSSSYQLDLTGDSWTGQASSDGYTVAATVPGSNYIDLLRNGSIKDPFYRFMDTNLKKLALDDWTYSRQFTLPEEILKYNSIMLICDGLDTIATVYVNDAVIGSTSNMFIRYQFDITAHAKKINSLKVNFKSAVTYVKNRSSQSKYDVPPDCPPDVQHGECHPNFIRKEQSSFSWDWGPSYPTVGIWKDIYITATDDIVMDSITVEVFPTDAFYTWWTVSLEINLQRASTAHHYVPLTIEMPELNIHNKETVAVLSDVLNGTFKVWNKNISHWWPNGYGEQKLYNLTVTLGAGGLSSTITKKIGFRSIRLIQEPIKNASGLMFYFEINGLPIFMKGSNWIPADSFQARVNISILEILLKSAQESHMNMLRVWGGGVYEQDDFYRLADEMGILIWQDIMFACAMYPTDRDFLSTVDDEVRYQIRRLKHHPSIAVWAGSNENEAALRDNWYNTSSNFDLYKADFVKLYIDTVKVRVEKEHKSGIFISSSPTNGVQSEKEGWVAKNPYDTHYGDVHYYNYAAGRWYNDDYPRSRFMSEYGMQSWPSLLTLKNVTLPIDLYEFSAFALDRNHHGQGQNQINAQIRAYFSPPNATTDNVKNFTMYSYLSQINQAMYIRMVSEFCRRSQNYLYGDEGYTMGALYWQLNDIWQAPTWSSIEYGGRWKMLHYYAKKFFAPVAVSMAMHKMNLTVYVIRDDSTVVEPVTFTLQCYSWDNFTVQSTWDIKKTLRYNQVSYRVFDLDINYVLWALNCTDRKRHFLYVNTTLGIGTEMALMPYKDIQGMEKPSLKIVNVTQSGSTFTVHLSSQAIAPFVWLETAVPGRFSDNGFLMITPKSQVDFLPWKSGETLELFTNSLTVVSLRDLYD